MSVAKRGEVAMYAIVVDLEEVWNKMNKETGKAMRSVNPRPAGVCPDAGRGIMSVLFRTPEERKEAYPQVREIYETAVLAAQVCYVDWKYLKENRKGGMQP